MVDEWMAAVYEIDRWQRAALALARFAQELVSVAPPLALGGVAPPLALGGVAPPLADAAPVPDAPSHQHAAADAAPLPGRPVWGPDNRPGVHDVLTWEEVMRLPWIEGEESILVRSP